MKNILVPTDFSVSAENAAHYAISLAKKLKASIVLCNAFKVPADAPMAAQVAWPLINEADLESESDSGLAQLVKELDQESCGPADSYCPQVTFESGKGEVLQVVEEIVHRRKIDLVVMGMAGAGRLVQWLLGSNSKLMIDHASFPVLYVPFDAKFSEIRKIAFATDLAVDELAPLQYLCSMAAPMGAEIMSYHIDTTDGKDTAQKEQGRDFLTRVFSKISYDGVKFETIYHSSINEGLKWIENNSEIDLLAVVHRPHSLVHKLIDGSQTHQLARAAKIPLLVFQAGKEA